MISPLPSMEHTFTVKIKGDRTKTVYEGTFTYKIPDLRAESMIEKTNARLNEGLELSGDIRFLHEAVSYLGHSLIASPSWWSEKLVNLETHDYNVYNDIFSECLKFRKEWGEKVSANDTETESGKTTKAS